jgi:hypothetical protein
MHIDTDCNLLKYTSWPLRIFHTSVVVRNLPLYLVCPVLLCAVGETPYGIRVGFIGLNEVLTAFLFICI